MRLELGQNGGLLGGSDHGIKTVSYEITQRGEVAARLRRGVTRATVESRGKGLVRLGLGQNGGLLGGSDHGIQIISDGITKRGEGAARRRRGVTWAAAESARQGLMRLELGRYRGLLGGSDRRTKNISDGITQRGEVAASRRR